MAEHTLARRSPLPITRCLLPALAALALAAAPLRAQLLRLEVVDAGSGRSVPGALVGILDARGQVVLRTATSSTGRRAVALPGGGAYRVHVRRIGYEPYTSPAITVAVGDTVPLVVRLPNRPVVLPAVRSTGAAQCDLRDGAGGAERVRVFTLWEQLRTALALTELARQDAAGGDTLDAEHAPGEVLQYVTRLAPDRHTVLRHTVRPAQPAQPRPFATFTPAELSARGYVRHEPSGLVVAAPDERVLLSDAFAAEHCFRLVPGDGARAGMVGIAFTPARDRRVPDIAGVLWADSATLRLRV
ncbi:MAG TPA: carboxypeptidase-like regulatory domain-containing protein, partial [Gemmatimonadaceae bacterium]|nr:carboxypeptidase-like regulatory domain-containing protein [Gemmatimonadaceae bacterium]